MVLGTGTLTAVAGCLGGGDDALDLTGERHVDVTVGLDNENVFDPQEVRVSQGAMVHWTADSSGHTVTPTDQPSDAAWDGATDPLDGGQEYEFTFEVPGEYEYVCEPHEDSDMTGVVYVEEGYVEGDDHDHDDH